MPQQFGSFPFDSIHVDNYAHPQFINANRAPTSNDIYQPGTRWQDSSVTPKIVYETTGSGDWQSGGNIEATTTNFGIVELATLAELQTGTAPGDQVPTANDVATVIAGVVAGAVPPANESQAGIAEIATQAETDAGTDDTRIVSPLKLATYVAGGSGNGSFVDLTATGTVSFTGATGAYSITSATASDVGVTGAGIDLTVDSAAGQLILTGGEAAANAVRIQADDAAGGIDVDAGTGGIAIDSTGAISLDGAAASNFSVTGAGVDLNLASSAGRIIATAGEDAADAIYLRANAGTSETIRLHADQGTGAASIGLVSDVGGITLTAGLASNDAVNVASTGGVDVDAAMQVNIASSQNAADAIVLNASAGGIDITNTGTAGEDIDIASTGASVNISSTENAAQAIYIRANGGTSETIDIHSDQGTGAASVVVRSDVGGVTLTSGLASADAINITASDAAGGIDVDAGTAGVIVDTTGGISLDAAAASNFTATGAFDVTVNSTAGSVIINGEEAVADAIQLQSAAGGIDVNAALEINIDSSEAAVADAVRIVASAADGGIDIDAGTGGITIDSTGALSLDGAAASNLSVSGAGIDLTLASSAGRVVVDGGEAAADAVLIDASDAAGGVTISAGTGNINLSDTDVDITAGNLILSGAGTQIQIESGAATDFVGTATLTAGTVTIANTNIAATDLIFLSRQSINGSSALGSLTYSISAATSFTITSVQAGTPAATETNDVSIVKYFIVRGI